MSTLTYIDNGAMTLEEAKESLDIILGWHDNNEPADSKTDFMVAITKGINILAANAAFTALFKVK